MINGSIKTYDVVILTHAPHDDLFYSIQKLREQTIKPKTIIIYNTDKDRFYDNITKKNELDTLFASLKDDGIKFTRVDIDEDEFDHGKARNDAANIVTSDYVLFMTDDAIPYDEKLSINLMSAFVEYSDEKSKVAVSYARQLAKENAKFKERIIREYNYPSRDIVKEKSKEKILGIKNYFCSNVCAMYDMSIFKSLGKFEENIILNEDTFYVYKAIQNGYKIVYSSKALVLHSHNLTYMNQFSRNFDIGVSQRERKELFQSIKSEKEGLNLIKYALPRFLKGCHFISLCDFIIDCIYRYCGYRQGINYEKLSIDKCIKYANNKKFFLKRARHN